MDRKLAIGSKAANSIKRTISVLIVEFLKGEFWDRLYLTNKVNDTVDSITCIIQTFADDTNMTNTVTTEAQVII